MPVAKGSGAFAPRYRWDSDEFVGLRQAAWGVRNYRHGSLAYERSVAVLLVEFDRARRAGAPALDTLLVLLDLVRER